MTVLAPIQCNKPFLPLMYSRCSSRLLKNCLKIRRLIFTSSTGVVNNERKVEVQIKLNFLEALLSVFTVFD
jgi:hypothetical protein